MIPTHSLHVSHVICTCDDQYLAVSRYRILWQQPLLQYNNNGCLPEEENPSWLQATLASSTPQRSSHTVPHVPLMQTSTRPSKKVEPPTSLISPSVQSVCF